MDQIKIGKFIAERRKQNNLTQMQLAEKLNITDRAISKWENGKGMPDSSLMLELCDYLKISVNELLNGEMIEMKEYDKRAEELLLEMARVDEQQNKRLMTSMWTMIITSVIFYIGILSLSVSLLTEGPILGAIICASTAVFVIAAFIALKFEVEAGYYECKKCHHKFVPTYMQALMAMHMSTTRYLKCPECHKRSWAKKAMYK